MFNDTTFVPYSPLFILPIFIGAAHAILRYRLFDVRVIAAEILTFVLLLAGFTQILLAESTLVKIVALAEVSFILLVGVILIKSVLVEVKQREELQVLSQKLKDANLKLKDLDHARAEFISIASHQLRTPPATIKWYMSAILAGDFGKLEGELLEALKSVQLTNNELMSLIEDMLNASRIERGTMEFDFTEVDLISVVNAGVVELTPQAVAKKLKLIFNKPAKPIPQVVADREKIAQVVNNFIDNAVKYTKEGSITVSMDANDEFVTIKVSDTGKGMDKEALQGSFEKYKRGADSTKYSSGLGLGLYVAKIIVVQHHGKIWAESKGVGRGSTFIFQLPIHSELEARKSFLDLKQERRE